MFQANLRIRMRRTKNKIGGIPMANHEVSRLVSFRFNFSSSKAYMSLTVTFKNILKPILIILTRQCYIICKGK